MGRLTLNVLLSFAQFEREVTGERIRDKIAASALIKAIARGRAWFEELASGRARSLYELAKRDRISRRYIRRLVNLAFLSPKLIEAMLQGRQPVELTATRLTELDLPIDWTEQPNCLPGEPKTRASTSSIANGGASQVGLHQCRSEKKHKGQPGRR